MKKGWKIVLGVGLGLILLTLLSVGFTQTKIFRDWLRGYLLNRVHENTNAQLYLGEFSGSLFTGLTIAGVSLSLDGEEIFTSDIVELQYNPLELFQKHIALGKLVFSRPKLHLSRSTNGVWNLERLPKGKPSTTSSPSLLPWILELKSVEIVDGDFTLLDYAVSEADANHTSASQADMNLYRHVVLRNINSKISARISSKEVTISVDRLSLKAPSFSTQLDQFSGLLQYSREKLILKNLTLRTPNSALTINGQVDSLNISRDFEDQGFGNRRIRVDLTAPLINFDELRKFIPASPLQDGYVQMNMRVSGTLSNLNLEQLTLRTERSQLSLNGQIQDLLHPRNSLLNLTLSAPSIEPSEIGMYLSSLELPGMSHWGRAEVNAHFRGKLTDFEAQIEGDVRGVGRFDVSGKLDLRGSSAQYEGKLSTEGLNLGTLLSDARLASRLNLSAEIVGRGAQREDANLTATIRADSSEIFALPFRNSIATVTVKENVIEGSIAINSHQSALRIGGTLDLHSETEPRYDLEGAFSSIDLARILQNDHYTSDLNGTVALHGVGRDVDRLTGSLDLTFGESQFRGHAFQGPGVKVSLDQRVHSKKAVHVESPILDAKMEGDFHLPPFLSLVKFEVDNILYSLREKLPFVDTTRTLSRAVKSSTPSTAPRIPESVAEEYLNFHYTADVKNLVPLAIFLGEEDFRAKASVSGSIVGTADDLLFIANAVVDNFVYKGKETRILLARGTAHLQVDHLKRENVLDLMENKVDVSASTFILNGLRMNNLRASIDYLHGKGSFDASALIDSALTVETNGVVTVMSDGYESRFENLTLDHSGYVWSNPSPIVVTIDTTGLVLRGAELVHRATRLTLSGGIQPTRELALSVILKNYDLSDLRYVLALEGRIGESKGFHGLASAEATVSGRLRNPSFNVHATASGLRYGAAEFGTFQADVKYAKQAATVDLELRSSAQAQGKKPDLRIVGSLPLELAFRDVDNRVLEVPLDLRVEATDFHLDLLDPFIPVFDNIEGRFSADVRFGGTAQKPLSSGSMHLEDGKFLFAPNGITYFVSGTFEPVGEKILIPKLNVRNDARDPEPKGLTLTGEITMRDFSIGSFDISGQGQLLILKETARRGNTTPYGNLFIGIGDNGLRYRGSFERSWLTGSVVVKTMSVTFPPVALLPSTLPTSSFLYTVIDDTSKPLARSEPEDSLSSELFPQRENGTNSESFSRSHSNTFDKFVSGMMADVSIETQGSAQLRMIIAYSTGEELFSELHGKLLLTKDEFGTRFTGDVDVGARSYYYFYKRFDATGKLKFAGALDNPEMDITAVYEGYRTRPASDTVGVSLPSKSREQRVVVTLKITGTRISPKLTMEMMVEGKEWAGDVQSDAIAFILSGKFRDDLTTSERSQIATNLGTSVTSTVITGVTSSLFSGVLTDFLRRELGGFIRQAEVSYSGGSVSESADLRLTGEIGETVIRVGGRVFNDIGNANVSIQMPVGKIIGSPALEDLIIELERKVEGSSYATDEKKLTNGARIYYRITF